ncbi:hypothetical protein [Actinomadura meridiana]
MADWGVALIAAGSAFGGSMITGWYARVAGTRQAAAARHAGDRQADAMIETMRMTLEEQRAIRTAEERRQTYLRFLEAAETAIVTRRTGSSTEDVRLALQRTSMALLLAGPPDVVRTAQVFVESLRQEPSHSLDDLEKAKLLFVNAAQEALTRSVTGS